LKFDWFSGVKQTDFKLKNSSARVIYLHYKPSILVHNVIYNSTEMIRGIAAHHPRISISKVWLLAVVHV